MSAAPIDNLSRHPLNFLATRLVQQYTVRALLASWAGLAQGPSQVLFPSLCGLSQSHSASPQVSSPPACWFLGPNMPAPLRSGCWEAQVSLCNQILYVLDVYDGPLRCALECYQTNSSGVCVCKLGTNSWDCSTAIKDGGTELIVCWNGFQI